MTKPDENLGMPMEYPEVKPPIHLIEKKPADWSPTEAALFFSWFLANEQLRVDRLLSFLNAHIPNDYHQWENFLLAIGRTYEELLHTTQFSSRSEDGKLQLTNEGLALARDTGLLVAHLLTKVPESKAHWALLNDPGAFSHNRPVLKGSKENLYLDPIGAIYEARALVNGKKSVDLLRNTFTFWKERFR